MIAWARQRDPPLQPCIHELEALDEVRTGTRAYLAASFIGQGSALVRYVILSRLLGPEQLGLAALLILTAQFFELITDTASDRFIVQDAEGESTTLQKVVQAAMVVRGFVIAAALVLTSGLVSRMFGAPELAIALIGLAITPLIGGFEHMDMYRVQRSNNFMAASYAIMFGEVAGLIGTATAAWFVRDHSAVIYGLAFRALAVVVASHMSAERPYRWGFAFREAKRFITFAVPLFLNGLLFFLGSQGDRLIVNGLGKAELGRYSAILLLIANPTNALTKFLVNTHLPNMSAVRGAPAPFAIATEQLAGRTILLSLALIGGFAVVAPIFTPLLYGPAFKQPLVIFALMGVLQTARFLRLWPTTIALSLGRSTLAAVDNAARLIALPAAFLALRIEPGIASVLLGFILGEFCALMLTLHLSSIAGGVSSRPGMMRIATFLLACGVTVAWAWTVQFATMWAILPLLAVTAMVTFVITVQERPILRDLWVLGGETIRKLQARNAPPPLPPNGAE